MEEIQKIIKEGKRWEALKLYVKRDLRIEELNDVEKIKFMLLVDMAMESL